MRLSMTFPQLATQESGTAHGTEPPSLDPELPRRHHTGPRPASSMPRMLSIHDLAKPGNGIIVERPGKSGMQRRRGALYINEPAISRRTKRHAAFERWWWSLPGNIGYHSTEVPCLFAGKWSGLGCFGNVMLQQASRGAIRRTFVCSIRLHMARMHTRCMPKVRSPLCLRECGLVLL